MALDDKTLEVTITIDTKRIFDVATGKSIEERKQYQVKDIYTNNDLRQLLTRITPAEPVIPPA